LAPSVEVICAKAKLNTFMKTDDNRQVRVFISSTFRDMHAERDHLITVVFPELRERVEQLGLEFFDVDLRWGVPAKDANGETANSWEYCRQWIDRVQPFFVCILGQRYGWVPEPGHLKATEDRQRQEADHRSITEMEVRHAMLNTKLRRRSYFYLRGTAAPTDSSEWVDSPPLLRKLEQLKKEIRSTGRPVRDYPCEWTGNGFAGMEEFGCRVLDDLWSGVLRDERYVSKEVWRQELGGDPDLDARYTDESRPVPPDLAEALVALAKPMPLSAFDAERQQMEAFAQARVRWFQGRTTELKELADFIHSTDENAPRLAAVVAAPGQGKSALLAQLSIGGSQLSTLLILHFVGATERSASAHALVARLLDELDRSGITWPAERENGQETTRDFNSLCVQLAQRLGDYASERRIVILVDALNQLSDGHDLQWLPTRLGSGVRFVVSCVEESPSLGVQTSPERRVLRALASRHPSLLHVPLAPLMEADVRTIVVAYLAEYCHQLDSEHLDTLCAITPARNPLYLLVMLNELRTLGGNDLNRIVPARLASMSQDHPDAVSLFRRVLQRLEVFGPEPVRWWCLYLAHGRVGMASHELADLLARKLGANNAAAAMRIERGLRRYLQRRGPQLDFFHGQLRQAVFDLYDPEAEGAKVHLDIATYFHGQANFLESLDEQRARARRLPPTRRPANKRKGEELVYQRLTTLRATPPATAQFDQACEELEALLTDLFFLEAKVEAGLVFELVSDFSNAVAALPHTRTRHRILRLLEEGLRHDLHFIDRHPTTLFQCMWNSCWWYDCPDAAQHFDVPGEQQSPETQPSFYAAPKLHVLLDSWRELREQAVPSAIWLRSLRPSADRLGAGLKGLLRGHTSYVECVTFSPDGSRLASASGDGTIRVWEVASGSEILCLRGHTWAMAVAYSPDGRWLVTGGRDDTVRLWNASNGEEAGSLKTNGGALTVAVSRNSHTFACGTANGTVHIWDFSDLREVRRLRNHQGEVTGIAFSQNESIIASAERGAVLIWDIELGKQVGSFRGQDIGRAGVTFSPDGRRIVSGDRHRIIAWDIEKGIEVLSAGYENPTSVACSLDGRWIAAGGPGGVSIWDSENAEHFVSFHTHYLGARSVAISPHECDVACGDHYAIRLWRFHDRQQQSRLRWHGPRISTAAISPDARRIVCGEEDGTLRVWDAESALPIGNLRGHVDEVRSLSFSPDGAHLVSGSADATVRVWSIAEGGQVKWVRRHSDEVWAVAFSSDGQNVVSGSSDGTIRVWSSLTGAQICCLPQGYGDTDGLLVDSQSGIVVFRTGQNVEVWEMDGCRLRYRLPHQQGVGDVALSPDGRRIVTWCFGAWENAVRIWDPITGQCLSVIPADSFGPWVDVAAIAAGTRRSPWRAVCHGDWLDTSVISNWTGDEVAWYSGGHFSHRCTQSLWCGWSKDYLHVVKIEGSSDVTQSEQVGHANVAARFGGLLQAKRLGDRKKWWKFW
jgi:WD40 repeat protein